MRRINGARGGLKLAAGYRRRLAAGITVLLSVAVLPCAAHPRAAKPNIVFILTDDLGYGDVGAFFQNQRRAANPPGSPAHFTPALDALAADGVRLTQHYCAAPVCAPSRASLLLGVHQGHANVRDNQFDKALENNHTLGTVLKQAGYATAAIGKWGLQGKPATKEPDWPAHPLNRGFDYYYGYIRHADGHEHYPKEGPHRGAKEVWENRTEVSAGLDKCYTTDLFTARAKQWIIDHRQANAGQPFFLYLAYDTPHATLELPTQAYPGGRGIKGGLQWLGKPGTMINSAGGKIDSWYHPDYAAATYAHDGNPATPWPDVYKRYATDVRRIDDGVADLMQLLKDLAIDSDTLVVFASDNGPSIESYLPEQYAPTFFGSYGPFDGIKRDCWEGGLRVPAMARWPGTIPPGRVCAVPSSSCDWMPTFAEAAGVRAPARSDGVSLIPTLTGNEGQRQPRVYVEYSQEGRTPKFDEFEPARRNRQRKQMQALRIDDYVGVRYNIAVQSDPFEIYNVASDPKEAHDLGQRPDMAALQQQFKDTVLQVRRPGGGVKRPYDDELVPAVQPKSPLSPGLRWTLLPGTFPWVPQFDASLTTLTGFSKDLTETLPIANEDFGLLFSGYLQVPTDGEYTFTLRTDTGGVFRLHEATVIDADFGYAAGNAATETIRLKAGKHPMHLYYVHRGTIAPSRDLQWSGPGIVKQTVPAAAFLRDDTPLPGRAER